MPLVKTIFIFLIEFYQRIISPLFRSPLLNLFGGHRAGCRFWPTCSEYAKNVIKTHHLFKALQLSWRRIRKCHVFNEGGIDLVPIIKN